MKYKNRFGQFTLLNRPGLFAMSEGEGGGSAGGEGEGGNAGSGEGEGGNAGSGGKSFSEDDIKRLIEGEVSGLKNKNEELLNKLNAEKEKNKRFEGLDMDKVKKMMDSIEQSEEAKMISEGRLDELMQKKEDRWRSDFESKNNELKTKLSEAETSSSKYKNLYESKMVEDALRAAALKGGVRPEALDDVIRRGLDVFSLNSGNNEVEARNANGELMKTEDQYILTTDLFIGQLKSKAPHYWPNSEGGGNSGAGKPGSTQDAMTKLESLAGTGGQIDMKKYRELRGKING